MTNTEEGQGAEQEPSFCLNPHCPEPEKPLEVKKGHRRRLYCNSNCRKEAFEIRKAEEERRAEEERQRERERQEIYLITKRYGPILPDLLPDTVDYLRHLWFRGYQEMTDQIARMIAAEIERDRNSHVAERTALVEKVMFAGEQIEFQCVVSTEKGLAIDHGLAAWCEFCELASNQQLQSLLAYCESVLVARSALEPFFER
jgi:hypothetical protein